MSVMSVKKLEIMEAIAAGEFAFSADELTGAVEFALQVSSRTAATTAVVVALVRRDHIPDVGKWIAWAREALRLEGSYLHHLHKVGKMLIDLTSVTCDTQKWYPRLFATDFDKLYAMTRIPAEQLPAFLSRHGKALDQMTRTGMRAAVADWLGESPAEAGEQLALPGFDRALGEMAKFDAEALLAAVNSEDKAASSLRAGMGLLGAALEFEKRRACPDVQTLQAAKAALLCEIDEIEAVIAKTL